MTSSPDLYWLTNELGAAQAFHRERVASLFAGEPVEGIVTIAGTACGRSHGLAGTNDIDMLKSPDLWLDDVLSDMADRANWLADRSVFRPLVIEIDPFGVHFVDAVFGAHVYFHAGQVWSDRLDYDLADLNFPSLANLAVLQQSLQLARCAVERTRQQILVAMPVLSCPINIAINLFGEHMLEALIQRPLVAKRALRLIADTILACARAFADVIPAEVRRCSVTLNRYMPPGYAFIDGCATQLVSARHYRVFLAPLDAELLAPRGGMIHLCGAHAHHIPAWRDMPNLRAVQINDRATDDLELYVHGLRTDQILYVSPTERTPATRVLELVPASRLVLQCDRLPSM